MIEWLIVGGGIHGIYMSNLLTGGIGVERDDIRVLDPHSEPLACWLTHTKNSGMRYLRSPAAHNLDLDILSVYRFAKSKTGRPYADFADPYFRPSRGLFERHCRRVLNERGLSQLHIQGKATALHRDHSAVAVELESGERIAARHVLLAIGLSEQPYWPDWAVELRRQGEYVYHLFDPAFNRDRCTGSIAVIGAGSSGAQLAVYLSEKQANRVTLFSRHPVRVSNYDFDPCWIGPKCMREFGHLDWNQRRRVIDQNRFPGTIPPDVALQLQTALKTGRLEMQVADIRRASHGGKGITLRLASGLSREFERVVLATGFCTERPGGDFVDQAIAEFDLKCNACGYPILDEYLRWHDHLFVTGPLAELQIGPCSRNIIGARNAGKRLAALWRKRAVRAKSAGFEHSE
jgi:lysine/ornithine N-monooxygenase